MTNIAGGAMMLMFANRLNYKQFEDFFSGVGKVVSVKKSSHEGVLDVFFRDGDKVFWYSVSDVHICAPSFFKTSEDWKFFLKEIFGDAYINECIELPVVNAFMEKFSTECAVELLSTKSIAFESIYEVEAFRIGTKRFKITSHNGSIKELLVGPHYIYCNEMLGISEKTYMNFMTSKFGMEFINYFIGVEKEIASRKVANYKAKCNNAVQRKLNYMVNIIQNNFERVQY